MNKIDDLREKEHRQEIMSYNQIDELIYAGNNMCCQMHFDKYLLSQGVTADISLEGERLDNPQGVLYFFWFPWRENEAPPLELINLAIKTIEALKEQKSKMYIHCRNGHGRTTTLLVAYYMKMKRLSVAAALEMVLQKRPSGHVNQNQLDFLKLLESKWGN